MESLILYEHLWSKLNGKLSLFVFLVRYVVHSCFDVVFLVLQALVDAGHHGLGATCITYCMSWRSLIAFVVLALYYWWLTLYGCSIFGSPLLGSQFLRNLSRFLK